MNKKQKNVQIDKVEQSDATRGNKGEKLPTFWRSDLITSPSPKKGGKIVSSILNPLNYVSSQVEYFVLTFLTRITSHSITYTCV